MFSNQWARVALLTTAIALTAAACGSSTTTGPTDTGQVEPAPTGSELPVADAPDDDGPAVTGTCLAGEPDCQYKGAADEDVSDLPPPIDAEPASDSASGTVSSGMLVDGGLSVAEALATDATTVLAVQGHLFDDGSGPRLCDALEGQGERYGCGGAQIAVEGLDLGSIDSQLIYHDGIVYTDQPVTLFGFLSDDILTIDELVAG